MATPVLTPDQFLELFDEFKKVPQVKLKLLINIAIGRVDPNTWLTNTQYAVALLTAHMLASGGGAGGTGGAAGGALTDVTVGDLSRSYAQVGVPGSGDQELLLTRYGAQFVELRRETFTTALATGPSTTMPPQAEVPGWWRL